MKLLSNITTFDCDTRIGRFSVVVTSTYNGMLWSCTRSSQPPTPLRSLVSYINAERPQHRPGNCEWFTDDEHVRNMLTELSLRPNHVAAAALSDRLQELEAPEWLWMAIVDDDRLMGLLEAERTQLPQPGVLYFRADIHQRIDGTTVRPVGDRAVVTEGNDRFRVGDFVLQQPDGSLVLDQRLPWDVLRRLVQ
jgi:hypothetical protein